MFTNKWALAVVFTALAITAQAGLAQGVFLTPAVNDTKVVQHGGGCRKASPPGQCCHAGSQPYHCH